jgi:epoxyqueuosine reductase
MKSALRMRRLLRPRLRGHRPIHERAAAKYAGLGWLGKNTLLISQTAGSWLFLGTILTTLPLAPRSAPTSCHRPTAVEAAAPA